MQEDLFIPQKLTREQLSQYEERGYLLLGRTLTDRGLEEMRRQCMDAWRAEKNDFDPEATWLQNALLGDIHHHSSIARGYYFGGPLVDVAEQLIGPNIKCATSQLTFKLRGNTMPFGWHQDNIYGELDPYNAVSTLTALDDADRGNGCVWIIPGSHKRGQVATGMGVESKKQEAAVELEVDGSDAIAAEMKAGECLLFSCWMLHRSEGNLSKDRDRRILFMRYADANAVEVYNDRKPRLGRLLRGTTRFDEVRSFEAEL